jgi:hypothetical protein
MSKIDKLSKLAYKYMTDKCPQIKHPFTPVYFELLKDKRKSIKKVLEIGVGYEKTALPWRPYRTGASLLMWRDFFPNALIYGADNDPKAIYNGKRIKSFLCNQSKKEDLTKLIKKVGSDIDLLIDDGSHKLKDQIFTCLTLMPMIKKDVIYIIEDVKYPKKISSALKRYDCWIPNLKRQFKDDNVVVVRNKQ